MQNEEKKVNKGFFSNTKSELKKVVWPTGKQTVKGTAATIGFVFLITVVLVVLNLVFDFASNKAYGWMLGVEKENEIVTTISGDVSGETADVVSGETSGEAIVSGDTTTVVE